MASGRIEVPVIGTFYCETDHFADWLSSVESQRDDSIDPIPMIIISPGSEYFNDLKVCTLRAISEGRIRDENVQYLCKNEGHSGAINRGIDRFIRYPKIWPWIATLDPDARFAPKALNKMVNTSQDEKTGMVSPLVVVPRENGDFRRPVELKEVVCMAGHYPTKSIDFDQPLLNYWRSYFYKREVEYVYEFIKKQPAFAPFTPCFCSSIWKTKMLCDIGPLDQRQFRTLICVEIGCRAQLQGWHCAFNSEAIAFHPKMIEKNYAADLAIKNPGSTAWHYFHAQALIALRYFPDDWRNKAVYRKGEYLPWDSFFPDLLGIEPDLENKIRENVFNPWLMPAS